MEYTHRVFEPANLIGIANVPDEPLAEKTAVIFVNGGFLHRVGPYRLYTDVARILDREGFYVFRFDLSGLGDSEGAGDIDVEEQHQTDIKNAVNFMRTEYNCSRIVLCGLCSGADDSLTAALDDSNINGLLFLDPPGFRTPRYYVNRVFRHFRARIFNARKWTVFFNKLTNRIKQRYLYKQNTLPIESRLDDEYRPLMEAKNLIKTIRRLSDRSVKMHFIYTGGVFKYYNYPGQIFDMLSAVDLKGLLSESFYQDADHMLLLNGHRKAVITDMTSWLVKCFGDQTRSSNTEHKTAVENTRDLSDAA